MSAAFSDLLLSDFLRCKYKCYLRLKNISSNENKIEWDFFEIESRYKISAYEYFRQNYPDVNYDNNPRDIFTALIRPSRYYLNLSVKNDELSFYLDAVHRKKPRSNTLVSEEIFPIMFLPSEKTNKVDRLELGVRSTILADQLGITPRSGILIHGKDYLAKRVQLQTLVPTSKIIIRDLTSLTQTLDPPLHRLNDHCKVCQFSDYCLQLAVERDCLSLLPRLSSKEIDKLNKKGINTLTQYSYTYRPRRRRSKRTPGNTRHNTALQAVAIRVDRICVCAKPSLPSATSYLYIDVESIPDREFYYLICVLKSDAAKVERYQFWANNDEDERIIWLRFLSLMAGMKDYVIFHYGAFEIKYFSIMEKRYGGDKETIENMRSASFNVLSAIYAKIYFPTYSNTLKDVASYLGFNWSPDCTSGASSVIWRLVWEMSDNQDIMKGLLIYNYEDCKALRTVVQALKALSSKDASDAIYVEEMTQAFDHKYGEVNFVIPDMKKINKAAYFDYQLRKILVRTSSAARKNIRKEKKSKDLIPRISKDIVIAKPAYCAKCGEPEPYRHQRFTRLVFDLKAGPSGIRKWVVRYNFASYRCKRCRKLWNSFERECRPPSKYGLGLIGWCVYKNVTLRQTHGEVIEEAREIFGYNIARAVSSQFKKLASQRFSQLYDDLVKEITRGSLVHADETKIDFVDGKGYVWVFTNVDSVAFVYRSTREGAFLKELFEDFSGILITDFYTAYDSIDCIQQKCLIHLIRDINDDLFKNPFDKQLKELAENFTIVLKPIIDTIDQFGLRKHYLKRHRRFVDTFLEGVLSQDYTSEFATSYQRRIEKNRDKLFRFIEYDGIPWNNNNAENAIKRFAELRRNIGGRSTEEGIREYLILLSISETLKRKRRNVLRFFMSETIDESILLA